MVPTLTTDLLEIADADDGPRDGPPVLLLHGWPASPRTWREVASRLTEAGDRTIVLAAGHRRVVVPGAGHVVPREAPGTVADLVLDHLPVG